MCLSFQNQQSFDCFLFIIFLLQNIPVINNFFISFIFVFPVVSTTTSFAFYGHSKIVLKEYVDISNHFHSWIKFHPS